jgi:hypothetical protein
MGENRRCGLYRRVLTWLPCSVLRAAWWARNLQARCKRFLPVQQSTRTPALDIMQFNPGKNADAKLRKSRPTPQHKTEMAADRLVRGWIDWRNSRDWRRARTPSGDVTIFD